MTNARQALIEAYTYIMVGADKGGSANIYRDVRLRAPFQRLMSSLEEPEGPQAWAEVHDLVAYFVAEYGLGAGIPQTVIDQMTTRLQQVVDLAAKEHPIWVAPPQLN